MEKVHVTIFKQVTFPNVEYSEFWPHTFLSVLNKIRYQGVISSGPYVEVISFKVSHLTNNLAVYSLRGVTRKGLSLFCLCHSKNIAAF